ncbi:MAG: hypothetical protein ABIH76_08260 [Candidatus Bathyarchaeota archaeon]
MEEITFSIDTCVAVQQDIEEAACMAEEFFHSIPDPYQLKVDTANFNWVHTRFPECLNIIKSGEKVAGVTMIIPATTQLRNDFLSKKISEFELFERIKQTVTRENFDAVYMCLVFVSSEFRGQALGQRSFEMSLRKLCGERKIPLFFWAYVPCGTVVAKKVATALGLDISGIEGAAHPSSGQACGV